MHPPIVYLLGSGLALAGLLTLHLLPQLTSVLLLLFAGAVLAVLLDTMTVAVERVLPGDRRIAFPVMLLGVLLILAVAGMLLAPPIVDQVLQLTQRLPQAWQQLRTQLEDYEVLRPLLAQADRPAQWFGGRDLWQQISNLISGTFGALFNLFVILFVGVYMAASPRRYMDVARYLLPPDREEEARVLAGNIGHALRYWVLGRSISMAVVGLATAIGLWLLGVPLAIALGVLAGLLSFVPYLGPILALVPALLIAAVESFMLAGWVLLLYGGVQAVESMLLTPLIQQRTISLLPAFLIGAQLIGGVLAGALGVLFAAPLVVTAAAAVRWSRDSASSRG